MKKQYDYRDPETIAEVMETLKQKRQNIIKEEETKEETKLDNLLDIKDDKPDEKNDNDISDEVDKKIEDSESKDSIQDKIEQSNYFFKNILFFTNDRDEKTNKTLKNLNDAVKNTDIEIFTFVADEISYKATDKEISFSDDKTKYKVNEQSNIDTIVITRLGVQESEECMELIKELQAWGFFVINPIQSAKKASNKYTSAVLLERYEIPQPRFTLVSKNDIKNGEESLSKKLKRVNKEIGKDLKADEKFEYVVKILDGHGGTGVFMTNGKGILAILQAMFAVDEDLELLVQKKEEADGGDIRVHVLTMRTQQKILAAMKRVKISGDFRSNVSLGATAEKVELTEEQKEIALKVAKISGMPWCAVDIMPLVSGSNPEIGDNVVLEYNSSPGTDGISEVIGENFVKILLDNINDINELVLEPKSIGYLEDITFTTENEQQFTLEAKFDTGNGAKASTIGCDSLEENGTLIEAVIEGKKYYFKKHGESNAIVGQVTENRKTVLIPCIQIGSRKLLNAEFALVDNRNKKQKILINRDVMTKMGYLINPAKKHVLDDELSWKFKEEAEKKKEQNK